MAGTMTPDDLSREGSPIPEASGEMEVAGQTIMAQTAIIPTLADLRASQSAPGSPSGICYSSRSPILILKNSSLSCYVGLLANGTTLICFVYALRQRKFCPT